MGLIGIGVDIVSVSRIADILRRRGSRLARRILSSEEQVDWANVVGSQGEAKFLAVRFCVKEAAYKAFYPTIAPSWKHLTYKSYGKLQPCSKPALLYCPPTSNERKLVGPIHVSVSHDGEYVVSSVVVESKR